jgi:branched-chain amino acid transport system ATP-binding protein
VFGHRSKSHRQFASVTLPIGLGVTAGGLTIALLVGWTLILARNEPLQSTSLLVLETEQDYARFQIDRRALTEAVWELFPALTRLRRRTAGLLSGGERQMLAIGSALVCGPRLLLVDEMSQGLAPRIVDDIAERLRQVRDRLGVSVLLVEQNAELALTMADHGYIMENGRIVLDGTPARLREHADVQEFYLGGSGERRSYREVKQYRRSRRWFG